MVPVSRIAIRDGQSYYAILFDDNNRKPIIRLHFNAKTKFVTVFGADKESVRHDVAGVEDVFACARRLRAWCVHTSSKTSRGHLVRFCPMLLQLSS